MRTARVIVGDVIVALPVAYLVQQTSWMSHFENIPCSMVNMRALIEANRTAGITWYLVGDKLSLSVPTEIIKWEA